MLTEIVSYKCVPGVAAKDHLTAAREAHAAVIAGRPGFLRRVLGKVAEDPTDTWVDFVQWREETDLDAAMRVVSSDPACKAWLASIAMQSVVSSRLRHVGAFGSADDAWEDDSVRCWVVTSWKTHAHVDPDIHRVGDERLHHDVIATLPEYRGMTLYRSLDEVEWTELMGWSTIESARAAIKQVTESQAPVVLEHFRESDLATASMLFVEPKLRMRVG